MIEILGSLREEDPAAPAPAETVAADIARGQRARSRKRLWRVVGTGVVAAAVATAVGVGGAVGGGTHRDDVASAPSSTASSSRQQTSAVQLAAYTGAQPAGFTVATVPAGWTVRSSDAFAFVVQPPGDTSHVRGDYENAITVMLQDEFDIPTYDITHVTVNGRPGTLGITQDRGATWLIFPDGKGHHVVVQVLA
jgi:hypothetical protein